MALTKTIMITRKKLQDANMIVSRHIPSQYNFVIMKIYLGLQKQLPLYLHLMKMQ